MRFVFPRWRLDKANGKTPVTPFSRKRAHQGLAFRVREQRLPNPSLIGTSRLQIEITAFHPLLDESCGSGFIITSIEYLLSWRSTQLSFLVDEPAANEVLVSHYHVHSITDDHINEDDTSDRNLLHPLSVTIEAVTDGVPLWQYREFFYIDACILSRFLRITGAISFCLFECNIKTIPCCTFR